jgi:hypothetical protein
LKRKKAPILTKSTNPNKKAPIHTKEHQSLQKSTNPYKKGNHLFNSHVTPHTTQNIQFGYVGHTVWVRSRTGHGTVRMLYWYVCHCKALVKPTFPFPRWPSREKGLRSPAKKASKADKAPGSVSRRNVSESEVHDNGSTIPIQRDNV